MSDVKSPENLEEFKAAVDDAANYPEGLFITTAILPIMETDVWSNDEKRQEALEYFKEKRPEEFADFERFRELVHKSERDSI